MPGIDTLALAQGADGSASSDRPVDSNGRPKQGDPPRTPGTGLQLSSLFAIDDGNGGANVAITLVDDNAGVILPAAPTADWRSSAVGTR